MNISGVLWFQRRNKGLKMINNTFPFMDSLCQLCQTVKESSKINVYIPRGGLGGDDLKDRDKHEIICSSCTKRYFKLRDKTKGPLFKNKFSDITTEGNK